MITPRPVIVENRYRFLFGFIWSISGGFQRLLTTHVGTILKDSLRIRLLACWTYWIVRRRRLDCTDVWKPSKTNVVRLYWNRIKFIIRFYMVGTNSNVIYLLLIRSGSSKIGHSVSLYQTYVYKRATLIKAHIYIIWTDKRPHRCTEFYQTHLQLLFLGYLVWMENLHAKVIFFIQ